MTNMKVHVKCQKCGNEKMLPMTGNEPDGTARVECNFCPKCDGDFYEEEFFDSEGNQILTETN